MTSFTPTASSSTASTATVKTQHISRRGRSQTSSTTTRRHPAPPVSPIHQPASMYKYIRGVSGVIGSITDPSGVNYTTCSSDVKDIVSVMRAEYLDTHGYGKETVEIIKDAFDSATTAEEFVELASGCGMAVAELKWFWGGCLGAFNWYCRSVFLVTRISCAQKYKQCVLTICVISIPLYTLHTEQAKYYTCDVSDCSRRYVCRGLFSS